MPCHDWIQFHNRHRYDFENVNEKDSLLLMMLNEEVIEMNVRYNRVRVDCRWMAMVDEACPLYRARD